jgi:hypothetical protein
MALHLGRRPKTCECGHDERVHWLGSERRWFCSAPGCACKKRASAVEIELAEAEIQTGEVRTLARAREPRRRRSSPPVA